MGTLLYFLMLFLLILRIRSEVIRGRAWPLWIYLVGGPILCTVLLYYGDLPYVMSPKQGALLAGISLCFGILSFILLIVALIVIRLWHSRRAKKQALAAAAAAA